MSNMENDYYRGYVRVDLDAIEDNMDNLKTALAPETKMLAVIKTDGYGHGAVEIAQVLEQKDYVAGYAVACLEEGIILRRHGIKKMILILGTSFEQQFDRLLQYEITPTIFRLESARRLSQLAAEKGVVAPVHIKLDTGMGRIGFQPDEQSIEEICRIAALPGLSVEGIFTHFARADQIDKSHARGQIELFKDMIQKLSARGVTFKYHHCSNSAGILELPEANMDLARAGITMYGLAPSDEVDMMRVPLRPVLSLYSRVAYVKKVPKGMSISYGGTFTTKRESIIATIPLGYGDGYPRMLSNKGYVLIRGKKAPILGRVCMDQFMVDVTDIPEVQREDPVTLIGTDGEENITVEELGNLCGRFNYELVCNLGKRLPRAFYYYGKLVAKKDYFNE